MTNTNRNTGSARGKKDGVDFGGGREAAGKPSPEGTSFVVGVLWNDKDRQPIGLLVQRGFPKMLEADLIPWCVLPGRAKAQVRDLAKYAGMEFQRVTPPDPDQFRLL